MRKEFVEGVVRHQDAFGLDLPDATIERLADFYELVLEHNAFLHLVAPCSSEEFAVRHVLESLSLLEYLPEGAKFADVGAGAGLPSIACLLARADLRGTLIESKEKKARYLNTAIEALDLGKRARIISRQFEETESGDAQFVTCRALDKFTEKLPRLLKWSKGRTLLLFGGKNLRDALQKHQLPFTEKLMPLSEQRFLFVVGKRRR